jgi:hypothetical protein
MFIGILSRLIQKTEGDRWDISSVGEDCLSSCPIVPCPSSLSFHSKLHSGPTISHCSSLSSPLPSFSSSPLDPEGVDETGEKPLFYRHLRQNNFREKRTMSKPQLITEKKAVGRPKKVGLGWCYVPENFSQEDKIKLGNLLESAYCVFQLLHLFRMVKNQPKNAWIDLAYDYCDEHILNWSKTIKHLLNKGILERTKLLTDPYGFGIEIPRGLKGGQAYGYRFRDQKYREATFRKVQVTNPKILARLEKATNIKYPVQRWLVRNL